MGLVKLLKEIFNPEKEKITEDILKNYIILIRNLEIYPNSERYFKNLYNESFRIIEKFGFVENYCNNHFISTNLSVHFEGSLMSSYRYMTIKYDCEDPISLYLTSDRDDPDFLNIRTKEEVIEVDYFPKTDFSPIVIKKANIEEFNDFE